MASAEPSSLKRTYDEAELDNTLQHYQASSTIIAAQPISEKVTGSSGQVSVSPSVTEYKRLSSPPPKDTSGTAGSLPLHFTTDTLLAANTTKKQKLTAAEKEAKRLEKEVKDRQKAEEKSKKEKEKRLRDAEKGEKRRLKGEQSRLKEEERKVKEDEKKRKTEEKKRKDEEKRLKGEERERKAKSQLRLNAFFVQPSTSSSRSTGSPNRESKSPQSSRRSSIASVDGIDSKARGRSTSITPRKPQLPDYERSFLPFFVQPHTTLAPHNRFSRDSDGIRYAQAKLDECLDSASKPPDFARTVFNPYDLLHVSSHQHKRQRKPRWTVKDIITKMSGSSQHPVDLTGSKANQAIKPAEMLGSISTKYLRFAEDVRPPYIGTYTKLPGDYAGRRLCKNPFTRTLPQTNYDYDSEAEWEEPGEGEDLDSEGEEEVNEEDEDDDMEGFLDDEESGDGIRQKRRPILGDLEPSCTGLCWEDDFEARRRALTAERNPVDLQSFAMEVILDRPQLPIDPYSTAYWYTPSPIKPFHTSPSRSLHASMNPPRIPLTSINRTNVLFPNLTMPTNGLKTCIPSEDNPAATKAFKPPKRLISPEVINDFKVAVQGNDLTKAGLVEILKKQFPKQSKDAIKDTLGLIAERVGSKEADKRWTIKAEYQQS